MWLISTETESCFDELKTHQCGPSIVLRSKTSDGVLQEIYGYLRAHYALRALIAEVAYQFEEDPLGLSSHNRSGAARRTIARRPAFPPQQTKAAFIWFASEILPEQSRKDRRR